MNFIEPFGPFLLIALLLIGLIVIYRRQGRNQVLEEMIQHGEIGSITDFRGTLTVQENRRGLFLSLTKDSEARRVQFLYRWLIGNGRQAVLDGITFDGSARTVELKKGKKQESMPFSDFSAIQVREVAAKFVSVWHVELVSLKGKPLLFLSSRQEDRQTGFERTAPVAKGIAEIMSVPVQVIVDGKVWTSGWPPKSTIRTPH